MGNFEVTLTSFGFFKSPREIILKKVNETDEMIQIK